MPILLGALIPTLLVVLWFARINDLGPLLYMTLKYPLLMMRELPEQDRTGTLLLGLQWFLVTFAPLLALGFVGAWLALARKADFITLNLALWVLVGFGVVLAQKFSWWEYHYFLILVPLGILTVKAIEIIWDQVRAFTPATKPLRQQLSFAIFLMILFSPVLASWIMLGLRLARHDFALNPEERFRFQASLNPAYERARNSVAFLREQGSLPGDIFVFGPTLYYLMAGRNQAVALHGTIPELFLPRQWAEQRQQLEKALPPYIYLADDQVEFHRTRAPATIQFLNDNYLPLRKDTDGTWYVISATLRER